MKKNLILIVTIMAVCLAAAVQGANVSFEPHQVQLQILPGETGRTALTVHGFSSTSYSLNFLVGSRLKNSNIPRGWITAAYLWLDSKKDSSETTAYMDLVVSVPAEAAPGTYSGVLVPDDMRSSESITSQGVTLAIEVLER